MIKDSSQEPWLPPTQKWVVTFKNPDGTNNMGLTNDYNALPSLIDKILEIQGTNIVIWEDFINKGEPCEANR